MVPVRPSARCASTPGGIGTSMWRGEPEPISGASRSVRIIRSNQASSDVGSLRWAVTLTFS